ncbi:efflux transporter outer membrane subunit [Sphingomonas koreensis]|nr:efflux transporter outer membrane subunit [Sphingomonas koreensis]
MIGKRLLAGLAPLALVAGCTVGPDYHAPEMAVPTAYEGAIAPPPGGAIDPATWWTAFGDPQLDDLVKRALADNPDVAIAASRVRQARLQEIQARAGGKPTVDAMAGANYIHFSKNAGFSSLASLLGGGAGGGSSGGGSSGGGVALPGDSITTYSAGFDASWELDLFGGDRRGVESAEARAEAAVWNKRDAAVTLAAEVADAYFALRLDQQREAILNDEIARQQRALQISAHIAQAGLVPHIDVTRQNSSITSLQAALEPVRADIRVRAHALGILIGQPPEALTAERTPASAALAPGPVVRAGLPSDLLRRRPDVRAAERQLAGATADIGVAVADLYPKFNLTGVAEFISTALSNLLTGDSLQLTGSGAVQFPLLDWGKRKATVGLRKEDREQAYLNYKKTVLGALRDVEDPLAQIDAERRRNAALRRALTDSETTAHAIEARYQTGFVAQDSLLNAQTDVLKAREQVAISDTELRQETAALFKAIGGGWQADDEDSATARPSGLVAEDR